MPQYVYFDSTIVPTSPVIGWIDTTVGVWTGKLPPAVDLLEVTEDQWTAHLAKGHDVLSYAVTGGALVPYVRPSPVLTVAQQATAALSAGIVITSTASPDELNGTYAVDASTQNHIQAEMLALLASGGAMFADGTASIVWPDINGVNHTFTTAQFPPFALAVGAYVAGLYKCINGTLPSLIANTATIV